MGLTEIRPSVLPLIMGINWRLYSALVASTLLPVLYTTLRINFLGMLPVDQGYNIASQLSWVNVLYEVLQEGLILPLFFLLGSVLHDREALANRIRTGLITSAFLYVLLGAIVIIYLEPLLVFMHQKAEIIPQSIVYIRLEVISISISIIYRFIGLTFVILEKEKWLYILLIIQMILSVISDFFLVSPLDMSLKLGVNGIAIGNIFVNSVLCIVAWAGLVHLKIFNRRGYKLDFKWMSQWGRIGFISGTESFIRNLVFVFMIVRLINQVQEQGNFWVANNFIWGWLLLPILALGELVKRDAGTSPMNCQKRFNSYLITTGGICIVWVISIPIWEPFLNKFMGVKDFNTIYTIAIVSLPFFAVFAFNNVIDSIFYGLGRTDLILIQSAAVNIIFYGTVFVLNINGFFTPTLMNIIIIFGSGMVIDSILTGIMYWVLQKNKLLYR